MRQTFTRGLFIILRSTTPSCRQQYRARANPSPAFLRSPGVRSRPERFAVKIALLGDGGPEFFWIHPFAYVGDRFIGQIGNTPLALAGPKKGDTIAFGKRDIIDWMYMDAGAINGNYSARAILKTALPRDRAAFKRRFGLEFDF